MSNHIFKFILKTSQYPFVVSLCCYYILKFFLKKDDYVSLIFTVKKFQDVGTKSLFLNFQNSFSASYFPISQEKFDQNSSLTPLWNSN